MQVRNSVSHSAKCITCKLRLWRNINHPLFCADNNKPFSLLRGTVIESIVDFCCNIVIVRCCRQNTIDIIKNSIRLHCCDNCTIFEAIFAYMDVVIQQFLHPAQHTLYREWDFDSTNQRIKFYFFSIHVGDQHLCHFVLLCSYPIFIVGRHNICQQFGEILSIALYRAGKLGPVDTKAV